MKPTLFFIKATGCGHCELAEPVVRKLEKEGLVRVVVIDVVLEAWTVKGWAPSGTPTFVLHRPGETLDVQHMEQHVLDGIDPNDPEGDLRSWLKKQLR